jgi:hypothetical protein
MFYLCCGSGRHLSALVDPFSSFSSQCSSVNLAPVQTPELRSSIKLSSWQHLTQNYLNHFRPMLASRTFQRVRPLEAIRAHNLHLPPVIALGTEDRNSPNSRPIGKHMFEIARTSACRPESPVCCISTEIAILPENITLVPATANAGLLLLTSLKINLTVAFFSESACRRDGNASA